MKVAMTHPARVILMELDRYFPASPEKDRRLAADAAMGALMADGWIEEDVVRAMEAP